MAVKVRKFSVEPRIRLARGRDFSFGPGKAALLELIEQTGSISAAAKTMGMSYMRAWTLVRSLESAFPEPLVLKARGGSTRGGAALSATGRRVLGLYREMEAASQTASQAAGEQIRRLLNP